MRPEGWLLVLAPLVAHAAGELDANGVRLGASERAVKEHFPNANCQPLQWESRAADRRCDDSRILIAGLEASVTFYLKADAVEAFDLRFDSREVDRFAKLASEHLGKPEVTTTEKSRAFEWRANGEHALLGAQTGQRRASLLVWRGNFNDEIYKVR